jgi:fatty-acyl-CoA synthase
MEISTIGKLISDLAEAHPDREALIFPELDVRYSFAQMDALSTNIARNLHDMGFRKGDRLAVWANNIPEWVLLQFGTAKLGVVLLTVNTGLRRKELEYVLSQSECRGLAMVRAVGEVNFQEELEAIRSNLPELEHVFMLPDDGVRLMRPVPGELPDIPLDPNDCINMQYTSGTTGFPKGVMLSHHNILRNAKDLGDRLAMSSSDILCLTVPLFHCFGCVIGVLGAYTHASTIVALTEFQPLEVLRAVDTCRCTILYGVPAMFIAELNHPEFEDFDLTSLRGGIMAGSPCPREVMKDVISKMGASEMTIAYGLTEASPCVTMTFPADSLDLSVSTVGTALPDVDVRIVDPVSGDGMPVGEEGELITRGYHVMLGYYNMPEETERAIRDGWLYTGDLASMDENGYVRITGRSKDIIIRGGENISPREIEEILLTHPAIQEAYVYGVPDDFFVQKVAVAVRLRKAQSLEAESLKAFCGGLVAKFKVPEFVDFVDGFPTTPSGKIQKYKLSQMWVERRDGAQTGVAPGTA